MDKEIKEIEKAKSQFFANLSHEIKTPIANKHIATLVISTMP